jgi:small subunit ribosomal protein S27e
MKQEPNSRFVKVRCEKCKNEQIVFNRPSTEIRCLVCSETLAKPSGGSVKIKGTLEILS